VFRIYRTRRADVVERASIKCQVVRSVESGCDECVDVGVGGVDLSLEGIAVMAGPGRGQATSQYLSPPSVFPNWCHYLPSREKLKRAASGRRKRHLYRVT
jgi:hypothetical protein